MAIKTVRDHLELSPSQEAAIAADVDLDADRAVTTLKNVPAPAGASRVEAMRWDEGRQAVQRTQAAWSMARREGAPAEKTEAARKAFVAALIACGVPAKTVSL